MRREIVFTEIHKAKLLQAQEPELKSNFVKVQMHYTVVSGGTERACIMGMPNTPQSFPMSLGYCGVGTVIAIGDEVTRCKCGDRVLVYHGIHTDINVVNENDIYRVKNDNVDSLDAAFVIIAAMGLGGVRKLECEIGETALVLGQGLLGMFATQFLRLSGACPVIAADPNTSRQQLALKLGADYALDPLDKGFIATVKQLTYGRGINACVEVTGSSSALKTALQCASYMGRISLLGCTRISDCAIDFYSEVHKPGIKLIGAHNFVRPKVESFPHHWTNEDDCDAIIELIAAKRIQVRPIVSRVCDPSDATDIYNELCDDSSFPLGTVFDWRK